jgi:hypothetical protein
VTQAASESDWELLSLTRRVRLPPRPVAAAAANLGEAQIHRDRTAITDSASLPLSARVGAATVGAPGSRRGLAPLLTRPGSDSVRPGRGGGSGLSESRSPMAVFLC